MKNNYRPEIDGLRAIAVIPVILFHAGFEHFSGGFVGVDIFFVISGYLITTIILNDLDNGAFSYKKFYERRARRILPALCIVIIACIPFAYIWLGPQPLNHFSQSMIAAMLFFSNIYFLATSGYFGEVAETSLLLHTWSLSIEEQFYILFPLILLFGLKRGFGYAVAVLAFIFCFSFALMLSAIEEARLSAFFLLRMRAWELLIGVFVALFMNKHSFAMRGDGILSFIGLGMILLPVFIYTNETPYPSMYTVLPTLGAALILLFTRSESLTYRILTVRILVGIGLISYSAYLWHQPLLAFARIRLLHEPSMELMLFLSMLSLPLAYFSWKYVEQPFRRKDKAIGTKTFLLVCGITTASILAIAIAGWLNKGFIERFSEEKLQKIRPMYKIKFESAIKCSEYNEGHPFFKEYPLQDACIIGNHNAKPSFLLIGDSHANSVAIGLGEKVESLNVSGLNLSLSACLPVFRGESSYPRKDTVVWRRQQRENFFKLLQFDQLPETIIIASRWAMWMEALGFNNKEGGNEKGGLKWKHGLELPYKEAISLLIEETIDMILDSERNVILIYTIPEVGWHVPEYVVKSIHYDYADDINDSMATTSFDVFKQRNSDAFKALDAIGTHSNLKRIYPHTLFCDTYIKDRCVSIVNKKPLYTDDDHLSIYGSRIVAEEIIKSIKEFESQ